jgi:peptidoglycan hydrolase-like protein with peptidoglycan-binding domain
VVELQYILDVISTYFNDIPEVRQSGVFDAYTLDSVRAFQQMTGLIVDGIVGARTWRMLYDMYKDIQMLEPSSPELPVVPGPGAELPPYPGQALQMGDRGQNVRMLQEALNRLARFYPELPVIAADGIFGSETRDAVTAFQRKFSLIPDGIVGPITWQRLREELAAGAPSEAIGEMPGVSGEVLMMGSRGENVRELQRALNRYADRCGTPMVAVDGIFGPLTREAVMAVQRQGGIAVDGMAGPLTWSELTHGTCGEIMQNEGLPYPGSPLTLGARGDAVSALQYTLCVLERDFPQLASLIVDGVFGTATQDAVAFFQRAAGITPDGMVSQNTWNAIVKAYLVVHRCD